MNEQLRITAILGLTLSSPIVHFGQIPFPLDSGNFWQYEEADPMYEWRHIIQVGAPATLPNSRVYHLVTGYPAESNYFREDSSRVYAYNSTDSTEYVIYDFFASAGDTISVRDDPYRYIILRSVDSVLVFGNHRKRWTFEEGGPAWWSGQVVVEGIGLTEYTTEPGVGFLIHGAMIDGKEYGVIVETAESPWSLPTEFSLLQNYPNPFNPTTNISFSIPRSGIISLSVHDLLGRLVDVIVQDEFQAGNHAVQWSPTNLPSGLYYYRLIASGHVTTRSLIYLK